MKIKVNGRLTGDRLFFIQKDNKKGNMELVYCYYVIDF